MAERHIQTLLNRASYASITIATITIIILLLQTPETCIPKNTIPSKPHHKFPRSTCDFNHRQHIPLTKKNQKLWSSNTWTRKVSSFTQFFNPIKDLKLLRNDSRAICVSAGAGHEIMALREMGLRDVTGVEIVDSPPLVKRADPHNLPFFDQVFDFGFSAGFDEALFKGRFVREMERTVRIAGVVVLAVEEVSEEDGMSIAGLFANSRFVGMVNVSLVGVKMTRIIMRVTAP